MDLILQVFYSVFSAIILALALPSEITQFGIPSLTLIALVPLYLAFTRVKNYKEAFLAGFIQTGLTHFLSSFWLANFKDFPILTLGASTFGTALIGGGVLLFLYYPFSINKNKVDSYCLNLRFLKSPAFRILYFSGIYVLYEWYKSTGFLGYPWATLPAAIYKWPFLMQIASITGTYGITFLLAFFNGLLSEALIQYYKNHTKDNRQNFTSLCIALKLFLVLFILSSGYGVIKYNFKPKAQKYLNIVMVQQNSDPWKESSDNKSILLSQKLTQKELDAFEEEGKKAHLVAWSEGVLNFKFPSAVSHYENYPSKKPLAQFVRDIDTPLIAGGSYIRDRYREIYFNAALMYDREGNFRGYYGKNHLVPMAEAIPFLEFPKVKKILSRVIGISAGWSPGDQYVFFDIPCEYSEYKEIETIKNYDLSESFMEQQLRENKAPLVKIATPICYDDAFPDIMGPLFKNGAELYINLTDDSWSLKKSSEYQHFVVSSYRAIEYKIPLVRATNAGVSSIIDINGESLADLPVFKEASLHYSVPVYKRTYTTYARFGNWLPHLIFLLVFMYLLYSKLTFRRFDYIPSERKIKKSKKHKKNKK